MKSSMPIFTDNVTNVCAKDAQDLRFFAGEMMVPVNGWTRKECYKMIKMMQASKGLHPHLRYRARHALKVGEVFTNLQDEKVRMAVLKAGNNTFTRIHNFDQAKFNDIEPELHSVDVIMNEISGQVIVPQSANKLSMALKIVSLNLHTEKKFEVFAEVVKSAVEVVFGDLPKFVQRLTDAGEVSKGYTAEHVWTKQSDNITFLPVAK